MKNLTKAETEHFRSQVKVIDLLGNCDSSLLAANLKDLNRLSLPPYESGLVIDIVEVRKTQPAKRLKLDRSGYFVIMLMQGREQPIVVEHYTNDGVLQNVIEGKDAASICATILEMKLVSQIDHAAYLGREIAKAEFSNVYKLKFIQDKAQGHSDDCDKCGT